MTTTDVTEKFRSFEGRIAAQKGGFNLFALVQREDVPDRWDLIVSAPWIGSDKKAALEYLVAEIKSHLGKQDLINLSRIVFVDTDHLPAYPLNRIAEVEHGVVEIRDSNFGGLPIKHAFIITSKNPPS